MIFNKKISQIIHIISKYREVLFLWLDDVSNLNKYFLLLDSFIDDYQIILILALQ